jgi:hypothetical protein
MTEVSPQVDVSPVFLGTAGWAHKVTKIEAYKILKTFYENGFRWIDTATNYPIDREPKNYGKTISWISDFYADFPDLKVYVKVGSATNQGDSTQLINASYFSLIFDILRHRLGDCMSGLGIHWDNQTEDSDRTSLIDFFSEISLAGFAIGMSGITKPELYAANGIAANLPWIIQTNLSPARSSQIATEIDQLKMNFPEAKVYGYNLMGGIAFKGVPDLGNRLESLDGLLNDTVSESRCGTMKRIIGRCLDFNLGGVVIGPANYIQCMEWCTNLSRFPIE